MHRLALTVLLGLAAASGLACADVYTWTDAKGVLNVSNLAPPEGARVDKVVHDVARAVVPPPAPVSVADPLAQAEVLALAMRVRQLESEVDFARRQPPAAMEYAPIAPPPVQYAAEIAPQLSYSCDQAWNGCGNWLGFGSYPLGIVVLGAPAFHHRPLPGRGFHRSPMMQMRGQTPVRSPGKPRWH